MATIFSTNECTWAQTKLNILGRTLVGIRGFELKKEVEKEHLYAAGDNPIDIQSGNKKYTGNLKLLKFEVDALNDAAKLAGYEDITEVPHTLISIVCQYKKEGVNALRTVTATGVSFTELGVAMEQGAKMTEITLPFLSMKNLFA